MSVLTVRGGIPHVHRVTIDATGRYLPFKGGASNYIKFRTGLTQIKVFFSESDWNNNVDYLGPYNEWEGPVEANGIWLQGDGGNCDIELTTFERRS